VLFGVDDMPANYEVCWWIDGWSVGCVLRALRVCCVSCVKYWVGRVGGWVLNEVLFGVDDGPANYEVCQWIHVWCVACVCVCVCVCV